MLSYDPAILDKFDAEFTFVADLIEITNTSNYFCNADTDLFDASNNRYIQTEFIVPEIPQTAGFANEELQIRFGNLTWFVSYFLNEDRQGYQVILSKFYEKDIIAPYLRAFIEDFAIQGNDGILTINTETALWKKKPMRYPSATCPWPFKISSECGYAGAEVFCDRTIARCEELGNYHNFGGRRYISSIEGKKIYWGPEGS